MRMRTASRLTRSTCKWYIFLCYPLAEVTAAVDKGEMVACKGEMAACKVVVVVGGRSLLWSQLMWKTMRFP